MKELVTLSEFSNLTRLNSDNVLTLLERGSLSAELGPNGEVLIDITEIDPEEFPRSLGTLFEPTPKVSSDLIAEAIATEIVTSLEPMVEDALGLALHWASQEKESE